MVGGCWVLQSRVEGLSRLQETNSQWEEVPISNGPRKKWIFEDISTNWQWHKFIFVGGSSMPWWNWEVIQRKSRKIIQRLVKNRQTSVYDVRTRATDQVRQADQWQKLYSDNLFDFARPVGVCVKWPRRFCLGGRLPIAPANELLLPRLQSAAGDESD